MLARIWETHKRFIIGVVVAFLFLIVAHQIAVAPLGRAVRKSREDSRKGEKTLKQVFNPAAETPPTEGTLRRYREEYGRLKTDLDSMKRMVSFPVISPFVLPADEGMPDSYYLNVLSKTRREIEMAANSRAIALSKDLLKEKGAVDKTQVPEALVSLAVLRHTLLTAIAAGVSSLESVSIRAGERSAPVENLRLMERLIKVTVRGSPHSISVWLQNLGRRESFLMVSSASLKGPGKEEESDLVTAEIQVGPLVIEEETSKDVEEEE